MPRLIVEEIYCCMDSVFHVLRHSLDDISDEMEAIRVKHENDLDEMCFANKGWKDMVDETRSGDFLGAVIAEEDVQKDDMILHYVQC